MSSSGLIYDSSFSQPWGTVRISCGEESDNREMGSFVNFPMVKFTKLHAGVKLFSNFLVLVSLAGMILTMLPVAAMELKYNFYKNYNDYKDYSGVAPQQPASPELQRGEPAPKGPANDMEAFAIHINKINAHSVVVPNVDANDPKIYMEALKNGVAHALGSGLPGPPRLASGEAGVESSINRSIYLFAHSTSAPSLVAQYNAQFYLLHKLETGDEIEIVFWNKSYKYRVTDKKTVAADDTGFLAPQTEKEILILATCTPPGTTWKRLIIIAERV